jgi:hydroxymethylpyrimidine pyrophosphatase-like HAD family hydrolase
MTQHSALIAFFPETPMKYRLVALDLDGTLLDSSLQIRRQTIDALQRIRQQGVQVMIVTGRHHTAAHAYWHQLDLELPAICCNGTYIYDYHKRRPLAGNPLTRQEAGDLLAIFREHPVHAMVYVADAMTCEIDSPHLDGLRRWSASVPEAVRPRLELIDSFDRLINETETIWKFLAACEDSSALETFEQAVGARREFACVRSGVNTWYIAQLGIRLRWRTQSAFWATAMDSADWIRPPIHRAPGRTDGNGRIRSAVALWNRHLEQHNPVEWAEMAQSRPTAPKSCFPTATARCCSIAAAPDWLRPAARRAEEIPPTRHSKTPGHPEYGHTPASRRPPARSDRASATRSAWRWPKSCSPPNSTATVSRHRRPLHLHLPRRRLHDGRHLARSLLAGRHLWKLSKLIAFYDDNGISIDGHVVGWFADDTPSASKPTAGT